MRGGLTEVTLSERVYQGNAQWQLKRLPWALAKNPSEVVRGIPSVLGIDRPGDSRPVVTQVKDE